MSFSELGSLTAGNLQVVTTSGRGLTPEELADIALDRIIYVGGNCHPLIQEQAQAYRERIREVLVGCLHEMVRSHNTTLVNKFTQAGYPELVPILDL